LIAIRGLTDWAQGDWNSFLREEFGRLGRGTRGIAAPIRGITGPIPLAFRGFPAWRRRQHEGLRSRRSRGMIPPFGRRAPTPRPQTGRTGCHPRRTEDAAASGDDEAAVRPHIGLNVVRHATAARSCEGRVANVAGAPVAEVGDKPRSDGRGRSRRPDGLRPRRGRGTEPLPPRFMSLDPPRRWFFEAAVTSPARIERTIML